MASTVERVLRERMAQDRPEAKRSMLLEAAGSLDHPLYQALDLGEWVDGEAAILFLDIRRFTRLSMAYADQPSKVAKIVDAVVSAGAAGLMAYGAHINDFTGDGIMAVFGGDGNDMYAVHGDALHGASSLICDMKAALRAELLGVGIEEAVQVAIGLVSGPVRWQHVGVPGASRIQAIGEVAPLAAKYVTSEETKAWEVMIGGDVADAVPAHYKEARPPFVREHQGDRMTRDRWLLKAQEFHSDAPTKEAARALARPSFAALVGDPSPGPERTPGRVARPKTTG
jgi:class 3 adenylate cyclase